LRHQPAIPGPAAFVLVMVMHPAQLRCRHTGCRNSAEGDPDGGDEWPWRECAGGGAGDRHYGLGDGAQSGLRRAAHHGLGPVAHGDRAAIGCRSAGDSSRKNARALCQTSVQATRWAPASSLVSSASLRNVATTRAPSGPASRGRSELAIARASPRTAHSHNSPSRRPASKHPMTAVSAQTGATRSVSRRVRQEEPFQEPTWTGFRQQSPTLSYSSGWSSAQ